MRSFRYRMNHVQFDQAKLTSTLSATDIIVIALMQLLLIPFTLGLAFPFVQVFAMRTFLNRLEIVGDIDFKSIDASAERQKNGTAETASDFFDIEVL